MKVASFRGVRLLGTPFTDHMVDMHMWLIESEVLRETANLLS